MAASRCGKEETDCTPDGEEPGRRLPEGEAPLLPGLPGGELREGEGEGDSEREGEGGGEREGERGGEGFVSRVDKVEPQTGRDPPGGAVVSCRGEVGRDGPPCAPGGSESGRRAPEAKGDASLLAG